MRHVLFVTSQLLYGTLPDGFYPEKAATNESKITSQVRCACIGLWESCFPFFFKSNNMFDSLEAFLRVENDMIQTSSYPFWLNLLINRASRYISQSLGVLLRYDVKDIMRTRSDGDSGTGTPISDDQAKGITRFLLMQHDHRCIYVIVTLGYYY